MDGNGWRLHPERSPSREMRRCMGQAVMASSLRSRKPAQRCGDLAALQKAIRLQVSVTICKPQSAPETRSILSLIKMATTSSILRFGTLKSVSLIRQIRDVYKKWSDMMRDTSMTNIFPALMIFLKFRHR